MSLSIDDPRGSVQNPMPFEDVVAKFRVLASPVIEQSTLSGIEQKIEKLETLDDVSTFTQLLASNKNQALKSAG